MNIYGIIAIFIITIFLIGANIVNYLQAKIIIEYKKHLENILKENDEVLIFCLMQIIKESVRDDVQDFKTAFKCKEIIDKIYKKNEKRTI
jgi:hypothetical protein